LSTFKRFAIYQIYFYKKDPLKINVKSIFHKKTFKLINIFFFSNNFLVSDHNKPATSASPQSTPLDESDQSSECSSNAPLNADSNNKVGYSKNVVVFGAFCDL
jgi:hypothetical protein